MKVPCASTNPLSATTSAHCSSGIPACARSSKCQWALGFVRTIPVRSLRAKGGWLLINCLFTLRIYSLSLDTKHEHNQMVVPSRECSAPRELPENGEYPIGYRLALVH